jgi:S1-C subfamily serine protease
MKIYSYGNPLGNVRSFSSGVLSAVRAFNASESFTSRLGVVRWISLQHDSLSAPGSSGGALLDEFGRLVGVTSYGVHTGDAKLSFAIPIQYLAYIPKKGVVPGVPYYDALKDD